MRIIKFILLAVVVIVAVGCAALVAHLGLPTIRRMDPELLLGFPAGVVALSQPPATVAEREAAGGPLRYTQRFIAGADGDPDVRIVIVEPRDAARGRPGIVDMHGGGYTHGSPEASLGAAEGLALKFGVTAVSVDYRLAPGTRHPGSLHDNYAALKWLHANAAEIGVDPRRIAIIGFSAGGGHAAALAIHARDRGEVPILFQVLLAPMLDDRTGATFDPGPARGRFLWTREDNRNGWAALLGVEPGSAQVPVDAVPMRVENLAGLPPTYIGVGDLDLFATENESFAAKLEAAGVPTELHVFPGGFHGFELIVPSARVSRQARAALEDFMTRAFAAPLGDDPR